MKKLVLSRRHMLRGAAGGVLASIALPTLEAMLNSTGTAYAQGTPFPKRFGVFFWGNGVRLARWNPAATGAGWQLSEQLAGLANVKDYVSVVSGMEIKTGNERGHHAGCVGILSGAPMVTQDPGGAPFASTFSKPSIDQIAANHLKGTSRFRSLELGISRRVTTGEGTTLRYLSHNGPDNPNPPEYSPRNVFNRLFGAGFTAPGQAPPADPRLALRRSVLDAVLAEATTLHAKLGAADRQRLEQHMTGIRTLEQQIRSIEQATAPPPSACKAPATPTDPTSERLTDITNVMAGLVAMALACDLTRVFSIQFSGSVGGTVYSEVGATREHHGLTHDEAGDQPICNAINTFIVRKFATFLERLQQTTEGTGNLLDRCAILASSDVAEGQPHSLRDYPIIVAGRAGGALRFPGVHYRSTTRENTSKVLLTLLQSIDMPLTSFGTGGGLTSEVVGALRA
jgi:hypothetical protein